MASAASTPSSAAAKAVFMRISERSRPTETITRRFSVNRTRAYGAPWRRRIASTAASPRAPGADADAGADGVDGRAGGDGAGAAARGAGSGRAGGASGSGAEPNRSRMMSLSFTARVPRAGAGSRQRGRALRVAVLHGVAERTGHGQEPVQVQVHAGAGLLRHLVLDGQVEVVGAVLQRAERLLVLRENRGAEVLHVVQED